MSRFAIRIWVIFWFFCLTIGFFGFRLYQVQIIEHTHYAEAADQQSTSSKSNPGPRGKILATDKDGKLYPLAVSEWVYQLSVAPNQVKDKNHLADSLSAYLKGKLTKEQIYSQINNDKLYIPPLTKDIDEDMATEIRSADLAGVYLEPVLRRVYPEGDQLAPQVIGFVGGDGSGSYGVESWYNDILKGTKGSETEKIDSLGQLISIIGEQTPVSGKDVVLTIDNNIQYYVEKTLTEAITKYQADNGSIIVMDPRDGSILAMAGSPKYDPNNYSAVKSEDQNIYMCPATSNAYEPGSVMKPITMSLALDAGVVTPETTNTFSGEVTVDGHKITNALNKTYGKENMAQILENSDNVAMTWIGSLLGADKLREGLSKYGFGTKTGIDVAGEATGNLQKKESWHDLLRSTAAFGQGISATELQLATAYSVIANGGELVQPHVLKKTISSTGEEDVYQTVKKGSVISKQTSDQVIQMLIDVVEKGHGKKAKVEGIKVGGKTGTAQIASPDGGYYTDKYIGTFAGLFPADNPKVVMAVRLDNPRDVTFAESSAAPTFGDIANWLANYMSLR